MQALRVCCQGWLASGVGRSELVKFMTEQHVIATAATSAGNRMRSSSGCSILSIVVDTEDLVCWRCARDSMLLVYTDIIILQIDSQFHIKARWRS
jgi:hypothetical protein